MVRLSDSWIVRWLDCKIVGLSDTIEKSDFVGTVTAYNNMY